MADALALAISMERRIRILHLIDNLDLGGAQTVLFNCLPYADPKYEIVLASLHGNRTALFWKRAHALGLPVVVLSPYRWLPAYLLSLPWLLWRKRFDIVQCHLFGSNLLGKPLAKLFRVPLVISHDHSHEFRFAWPLLLALDRWANRFSDRVFVISEALLRRLHLEELIPEYKLIYLPNGVSASPPALRRSDHEAKIIGAAGRLVDWKNFDRFLRLARQLVSIDNGYRFLIAGDGPMLGCLQSLADELGIADKVTWKGALPSLVPFFAEIDFFVLTSDYEELPMVALEAFAAQVPTALVSVNPAREARKREALCLDPRADETNWASEIHTFLGQPDQVAKMVDSARALVDGQFSARAQIEKMEKVYESALGKKISRKDAKAPRED